MIISKHSIDTAIFVKYENNFITDLDPGFVNMEQENFKLKENSEVYKKIPDFKPVPFDKIGLQQK